MNQTKNFTSFFSSIFGLILIVCSLPTLANKEFKSSPVFIPNYGQWGVSNELNTLKFKAHAGIVGVKTSQQGEFWVYPNPTECGRIFIETQQQVAVYAIELLDVLRKNIAAEEQQL